MPKKTAKKLWLSGLAAQKRLGVSNYVLLQIAVCGRIRTLVEPGQFIKYHAADVERVAAEREQEPEGQASASKRKPSRRARQTAGA